jgi:signal transduction histidine kinase/CheY-like chemotaxis protein
MPMPIPVSEQERGREKLVYTAILFLALAVFVFDAMTPAGRAEWVFHLLPLALCIFQRRIRFPYFVAAGITVLMTAAAMLEPGTKETSDAVIRRLYALIAIWIVAGLVSRMLVERSRTRRLVWVQQGRAKVGTAMLGEQSLDELGRNFVAAVAQYAGASVGAAYRLESGNRLVFFGAFALSREQAAAEIAPGEGLIGQAVASDTVLRVEGMAPGALRIASATARAAAHHVLVTPMREEGRVVGALELGFTGDREALDSRAELMAAVAEDAGIALRSALYRQRLQELLAQTQSQAEELQTQQEELRVSNEELEEQGRALRESQARLENQHAELEQTNVQLEEQTQRLERQKQELVHAQRALSETARTLERSNRYKSEFLANMSHELRTPLNSSLILAKLLADNPKGTLDEEQVRFARTIHSSNNDLLTLINDILDLSKIEAGQVDIEPEPLGVEDLLEALRRTFEPIARDRKVDFHAKPAPGAPERIVTDAQRLQQILRNLLSNAFKFTARGEVTLQVRAVPGGRVAFDVRDTGIGIAPEQQEVIFEAFRQADGTTSRQFGGTGLGLSISRELARLLGGAIRVESAPGRGSCFTLDVPIETQRRTALSRSVEAPEMAPVAESQASTARGGGPEPKPTPAIAPPRQRSIGGITASGPHIDDDRSKRERPDRLILVVEDDLRFAQVLYDLAHELDFDCVHASTASEAIDLARRLKPSGILLDVGLPDESGLGVLERLKRDPAVRHIPVHMVSIEEHMQPALHLGAIGYAIKPATREELTRAINRLEERLQKRVSRVLVVEDDAELRGSIARLLQGESVQIVTVGTVAGAMRELAGEPFDCLVTDIALPDATGYDLLEKIGGEPRHAFLPVIVYTGRSLTRDEELKLRRYSKSVILKGARSPERLLDEVTLFLHRVESTLPEDQQTILRRARQRDEVLEGRTILLAEDDVRNIFALSRVLEPLGVHLEIARNGQEAVERVKQGGVDLVLMDVMMPVKDGLVATREIRADGASSKLPVIAITAKAMADDRRKCIEAGANDYIAKPIDVDKLVSLCRVWMAR